MDYKAQAYDIARNFESIYDYSEHYKIEGNPTVWKFMHLDKFESILETNSLFFARPKYFIDPLEGSFSKYDLQDAEGSVEQSIYTREFMKEIQNFSAISCWHINDYESAGMWDLYLSGKKDGIAIKTDYNSLINSITDPRYRIFDGKVQYIDFHKDMTSRNVYDTLFYKRKSFSHENELRLMIVASRYDEYFLERSFESEGVPYYEWDEKMGTLEEQSYNFSHEAGNLVSCEVDKLIQQVYVSPKSSKYFVKKVRDMATSHGFSRNKVIQSDLYKDFIY